MRPALARGNPAEAEPELDTLHALDAHHRRGERAVELPVPVDMAPEADRDPGRDDLEDAAFDYAAAIDAEVSNTFAARPEASVWIDLGPKVGLNIAAGYMFARPEVTVTSSLGRDTRQINADMFQVRIGAVYSVF